MFSCVAFLQTPRIDTQTQTQSTDTKTHLQLLRVSLGVHGMCVGQAGGVTQERARRREVEEKLCAVEAKGLKLNTLALLIAHAWQRNGPVGQLQQKSRNIVSRKKHTLKQNTLRMAAKQTHTRTHAHAHAHAHARTRAHAQAHTHTHAHTHTCRRISTWTSELVMLVQMTLMP